MKFESEKEMFEHIWNTRRHVSEVSGRALGEDGRAHFFSHILPKSTHPELKYESSNIMLMTMDEHNLWEHKKSEIEDDIMWRHVFMRAAELASGDEGTNWIHPFPADWEQFVDIRRFVPDISSKINRSPKDYFDEAGRYAPSSLMAAGCGPHVFMRKVKESEYVLNRRLKNPKGREVPLKMWRRMEKEAEGILLSSEEYRQHLELSQKCLASIAHMIPGSFVSDIQVDFEMQYCPVRAWLPYVGDNVLIDVQVVSDASREGFIKFASKPYLTAIGGKALAYNAIHGDIPSFHCIAIERKTKRIAVYCMDEWVEAGCAHFLVACNKFTATMEDGEIKGYEAEASDGKIIDLQIPKWLERSSPS